MKQIRLETGICHLRVERAMALSDFLVQLDLYPLALRPPPELVEEWLHYGCVFIDGRRHRENVPLTAGQVIRLHTRRKSYWSSVAALSPRVVFENADLLVFNKPSGLPTHATLDNFVENALFLLQRERGDTLYPTHRLDIPTSGLLVIAKTPLAQRAINKIFARGLVHKTYRALVSSPVSLGEHVHYLDPQSHVPKTTHLDSRPGWWQCRMVVNSCRARRADFELEIRLLTGKTHQIRAQLAALNAPVWGDTTYGSPHAWLDPQGIALQCARLEFELRTQSYSFSAPAAWAGHA